MTVAPLRSDTARPARTDDGAVDVGDRDVLLGLLECIEAEGWDGPAGSQVLRYARDRVVRPQLRRIAWRAPDADEVESSGWCAAWEALRRCAVTRPDSPWGLVTVAVRRAMLGELVAQVYDAPVRSAWCRREAGESPPRRPAADGAGLAHRSRVVEDAGSPLGLVVERMVALGWDADELRIVVDWLGGRSGTGRGPGWRALARRSGMPAWKVRRAVVLLAGAPGWPGLVQRVDEVGPAVLDTAGAIAAIRASLHPSHLSPPAAHRRAS